MNLRIPGPTPCAPEVLEAVSRQMINHRGPQMSTMMAGLDRKLHEFLQTEHDIFLVSASGTGGLETAVVNTLSPGDRVLGVTVGLFGDRFSAIAKAYGADLRRLEFDHGTAARPEDVRRAVREEPELRAVLVTHNETSTGVTNPLAEICEAIRAESDALILVDGISSTGSIPVLIDDWGIDVLVSGSQKGWAVPPGISIIAFGGRAWRAWEQARMPRFYFDLGSHRNSAKKGQTPWTPTLSVLYGLDVSLDRMLEEGRDAIFARHRNIAEKTRKGVESLGLELFAEAPFRSNTVTAVSIPSGVDGKKLTQHLLQKYDTVVGGGPGPLAGRIFRLGHLGWVEESDLDKALSVIEKALPELGFTGPGRNA